MMVVGGPLELVVQLDIHKKHAAFHRVDTDGDVERPECPCRDAVAGVRTRPVTGTGDIRPYSLGLPEGLGLAKQACDTVLLQQFDAITLGLLRLQPREVDLVQAVRAAFDAPIMPVFARRPVAGFGVDKDLGHGIAQFRVQLAGFVVAPADRRRGAMASLAVRG